MAGGSGGAEREAEDGAKMILELAGDGAFDGPVAGIVDARGHFVGEELALVFEKFDGEDADVLQGFENEAGGVFRGALDGGFKAGRGGEGEGGGGGAGMGFGEPVEC